MRIYPVQSEVVRAIGYDGRNLEITFTDGKIFSYADVSNRDVVTLMFAESVGRAYAAIIRPRYQGVWKNDDRPCQMIGVVDGGSQ